MTGSAVQAVDVVFRLLPGENLLELGGGPGGGGQQIRLVPRDADFVGGPKQSSHVGKLIFSQKYRFLVFPERRFTSMGAHVSTRIEVPCR